MNRQAKQYTPDAQRVLKYAREEAARQQRRLVGSEHILLGILKVNHPLIREILTSFTLQPALIRHVVESLAPPPMGAPASRQVLGPAARAVIEAAMKQAHDLGASRVGTEHLLLGLLSVEDSQAALTLGILEGFGMTLASVRERLLALYNEGTEDERSPEIASRTAPEPVASATRLQEYQERYQSTPELNMVSRDLTLLALEGQLDPLIGREVELERTLQTLVRYTKNNPLLLGDAGVGKTAIVEGLAQLIAADRVPEALQQRRVVALDIGLLLAGTRYRGDLEERIQGIFQEIKKTRDIILFIDEIHMLISAGSPASAPTTANLLKPLLARGQIQCIGATTFEEYARHVERDPALARRFQPINIAATSEQETLRILRALRPRYAEFHGVAISDEALLAAVRLADRYLSERSQPDKAIDLLDEAAARLCMARATLPATLHQLHEESRKLHEARDRAIRAGAFGEALILRRQEHQLLERQADLENEWQAQRLDQCEEVPHIVEERTIAQVVAQWTGIPATRIGLDEAARLLQLEDLLHQRVSGQEAAVSAVARAVRRARTNLRDRRRPAGTFLFAGPTGVGKTELARALAETLYGDEAALIKLDMSEYMERQQVMRLIGSPPGYQGYGEAGQLTEAVRRRPSSIVLFDEVEKAHPGVLDLLLQILEDGRLTDARGRVVDFRETLIILTTNAGADQTGSARTSLPGQVAQTTAGRVGSQLLRQVEEHFRPELLNRLDDIILFHPLGRQHLRQIVDLLIARTAERLASQAITLQVSSSARDLLINYGYDPEYGARPLRRAIRHLLEDALSEALLRGEIGRGMTVEVESVDGELQLRAHARASEERVSIASSHTHSAA